MNFILIVFFIMLVSAIIYVIASFSSAVSESLSWITMWERVSIVARNAAVVSALTVLIYYAIRIGTNIFS